jgi:general secretion pathway protein L
VTATFTAVRSQLHTFFNWWGEELFGMLPAWLAERASDAAPEFTVCIDRDGLRLFAETMSSGGRNADADEPPGDRPTQTGAAIAAQLTSAPRAKAGGTVGLRIPLTYCFSRLAELPSAAEKDFSRLLALDMERATPFRSSEVYSAFVIAPQVAGRPGKITVRQLIVKRSILAPAIAELEGAGLQVGRIDCWDDTGRAPLKVDFRGADASARLQERSLLRPIAAASAIAVLLALAGGYGNLSNLNASLTRLDAQAVELRAHAGSQRASQEAARTAQSTLAALETLVTTPPAKLAIIDELTQLLPDSAWVSDLRVTTDGVDINGYAKSTVALLPLLENSPRFMDATSSAAVTFDPREDKERFSIHVRYRPSAPTKAQVGDNRK